MSVVAGLRLGLGGRRLPVVLQTEAAECGLACLAMVSAYHGRADRLSTLRQRHGLSQKGASLKDLIRVAERIGLASRPLRLEIAELGELSTPCVLHWDLNHFVVLERVRGNRLVIHDPNVGARRVTLAEASRHFTGIALELSPTTTFETRREEPRVRLGQMLGTFSGIRRSLLHLLGLALAIEIFSILAPLFMQWVVDHALVSADRDLLVTLVVGFSLLLLIRVSVTTMRGWLVMGLSASLSVQARANLFTHLLGLPAAFFEARHLGDVMSRFDSQSVILEAITTELVEALLDGLMSVLTLVILFVYSPLLASLVVAGALLYGLIRWASYAALRRASAEAIVWGAKRDSHFIETLRGITSVKLFNAQEGRRAHWTNLVVETLNRELAVQKLELLVRTANALLLGGLVILVVWRGALQVLDGAFTVGMLLAFISYKDQFLTRISALIDRSVQLRMLKLHGERLADIALSDREEAGADEPCGRPGRSGRDVRAPSIEIDGVRFRYAENDPWVLDGISLRIEPGESVAIAGASGCGKSTLLKVLAGLLTPTEGRVLVDGEPLQRLGLRRHRAATGVVMQDDQLFAGSIADNITFFAEQPDEERMREAAALAAIHEDVLGMPMGYHTLIGDMGTVLSGGQKQRVLIARALYRRPGLLLLDEATSHLDVAREEAVNDALKALAITRLAIAHRPATIQAASRVVLLDGGRVAVDSATGPGLPEVSTALLS